MKKINAFEQIMKCGINVANVDKDRLFDLIRTVNQSFDKTAEIILYLQGQMDPERLPEGFSNNDYRNAVLKEYNFFTEKVLFEYDCPNQYWFKSEEEANQYAETGKRENSHWTKTETYQYCGTHYHRRTTDMEASRWIELCNKK